MKHFSHSDELSMEFDVLINVKIPTIVGIIIFISNINTIFESLKARKVFIFSILVFISSLNFLLS